MQIVSGNGSLLPWEAGLFALIVYGLLVLALVATLLFLSSWVGEKKKSPEKGRPYECGILPTGPGLFRYPVPFYLLAIFFLIFDVETAFIFAWAISFRELGWSGWLKISFFIILLLFSLFYLWKKGGLDWRPKASKNLIDLKI